MGTQNDLGKYPLYLQLVGATLGILSGAWIFMMYLMYFGLLQFGSIIATSVEVLLSIPLLLWWSMWLIMVVATKYKGPAHPIVMRISNRGLYALFPLVVFIGKVVGASKDRVSQALIDLINHLVELNMYKVPPDRLLLLTPHCLQKNTCPHKVTTDVHNCKRCGQCQVGTLLDIADEYSCKFVVVTGGTLARLMIKQARPKAIVAIACERDLVSGMSDVFPIPVIGVLNERPCGPCCNTRVDTDEIRRVVDKLVDTTKAEGQELNVDRPANR